MSWLGRLSRLMRHERLPATNDSEPLSSPESGIRRKMTNFGVVPIREVVLPRGDKRLAERRALEELYAEQRSALEGRFKQQGVTVFVADYSLAEAPSRAPFSYCVWTQGALTLLPETDFTVLTGVAAETGDYWELIVPWDVVLRVTGEACLVKEPDLIPVRWRSVLWPNRQMLEQLQSAGVRF